MDASRLCRIKNNKEINYLLLFKFPSNHSNDNLAILDKESSTLFLGDALCGEIIDYDFIKDLDTLKSQLKLLETLDFNIAIESHQNPVTKNDILEKLRNKIEELEK